MAGIQQTGTQDTVAFDGFKLVEKTGNVAKPDDYRDRYQTAAEVGGLETL
jgi:hypothetical protein